MANYTAKGWIIMKLLLTVIYITMINSLLLFFPNQVSANDTIYIWNSNAQYLNMGYTDYEFMVDSYFISDNPKNLSIETNYGYITFEGILDGSSAGRYSKGYLLCDKEMKEIVIRRVTAELEDGNRHDITDRIAFREYVPLPIRIEHRETPTSLAERIRIDEVDKVLIDAPIFFGEEFLDTPILGIKSIVESLDSFYGDTGNGIDIYAITDKEDIEREGPYLILANKNGHNFILLLETNNTPTYKDDSVKFSFSCKINSENEDLFGNICEDPIVKINSKTQEIGEMLTKHPVFMNAIKLAEEQGATTWRYAN
jgi:hypothetical protein